MNSSAVCARKTAKMVGEKLWRDQREETSGE